MDSHRAATKVPAATALFWVIKVLTTGIGEATSDYLGQWSLWLSAGASAAALTVAFWLQFRSPRYRPATYWFTVAMIAVFGTAAADCFRIGLHVELPYTTTGYALALAVCFAAWYATERTLSIHTIDTPRREVFYWLTVLLTFALGTAAGDLTGFYLDLGFVHSALLFGAAILVPWLLYRFAHLNAVAAFWASYVLTRPLGASLADYLGMDKPFGVGVGFGTTALLSAAVCAVLVGYAGWSYRRPQPQPTPVSSRVSS
ncbi:COG4705 family protein [Streptomyces hyaluromycini]|uniref:COG4705 family protein n=1 Tax=Streptomyces hyaluromycini TaxID=1377993 RepID=UPI000B5C6B8D|nr:hypothetical protein [Streptomyces hyaluromycini]